MNLTKRLHSSFTSITRIVGISQDEKIRFQYYSLFLMFGIPLMFIFGVSNYLSGSYWVSILATVSAIGLISGWCLIKYKRLSVSIYRVNAVLYLLLLSYLVIYGGEGGSKVLWIYTFPLVCYFLFGKSEGTIWSIIAITILTFLLFFSGSVIEMYPYHLEFRIRLLASYFTVTGIAFWLEHLRNFYNTSLQEKNRALNEEIIERRRIEKQREQLILEVQAANQAKSAFLANMSHEIRTPLNGVIGMTSMLSDTRLDQQQQYYVNTLRSSGEFLLTIINDILDVTKIEAGKFELNVRPFSLREVLDRFIDIVSRKIYSNNVELVIWADPALPEYITGDADRLQQVLLNLTSNALKFTPEGNVTVEVTLVEESSNGLMLKFSVTDTGIGIAEKNQAKLFQSFSQIDTSTTREYDGTGLGLHISKQLSELMGGDIGVTSTLTKGSQFWFTAKFLKSDDPTNLTAPRHLDKRTAMVATRNSVLQNMLTLHLSYWGAEIIHYESSSSLPGIIEALPSEKLPDFVFFDSSVIENSLAGDLQQLRATMNSSKVQFIYLVEENRPAYEIKDTPPDLVLLHKPVKFSALMQATTGDRVDDFSLSDSSYSVLSEPGGGQWKNRRILLAEDNPINREVLMGLLHKAGIQNVDAVDNGIDVLQALDTSTYDLILMDVSMPKMDGLTATGKIRNATSSLNSPQLPIIALTAHAIAGDRERCLKAGMNDYLTKPVIPEDLLQKLELWMHPSDEKPTPKDSSEPSPSSTKDFSAISQFEYDELLERMLGDAALVQGMLELFTREAPQQLQELSASIKSHDVESGAQQAHKLAGGVANLSMGRMHAIAKEIQYHCKTDNRAPLPELLSLLQSEYEKVESLIAALG